MACNTNFKIELVVHVLSGRKISEVAENNNISKGTLSRWKREFLDGNRSALESKNNSETKSELKKLKEEIYHTDDYKNILDCKSAVESYIEEYSQDRLHSSLDYLSPKEFIKQVESGIIVNEKLLA